jgi:hypothetical protein
MYGTTPEPAGIFFSFSLQGRLRKIPFIINIVGYSNKNSSFKYNK